MTQNRKIGRIYIIAGVILAFATAFATIGLINSRIAPPPPPTSNVVFTTVSIPQGTSMMEVVDADLNPADACPEVEVKSIPIGGVQVCQIPNEFLPATAITLDGLANDALDSPDVVRLALQAQFENTFTIVDLSAREVLQDAVLNEETAIEDNRRAITIAVNQATGIGSNLGPGQHVDVIVSYDMIDDDGERQLISEVLLQNVEILSVSGPVNQDFVRESVDEPPVDEEMTSTEFAPAPSELREVRYVTLSLSLEESVQLTYMTNFGTEVRLLTRRGDDQEIIDVNPVTTDSFQK